MLTCCTGGLQTVNEAFCFAQTPEREEENEKARNKRSITDTQSSRLTQR